MPLEGEVNLVEVGERKDTKPCIFRPVKPTRIDFIKAITDST